MLDAIHLAQPFPVVPDAIRQDLFQISLEFRYEIVARTSPPRRPVATVDHLPLNTAFRGVSGSGFPYSRTS
jgi:hypothetical protein